MASKMAEKNQYNPLRVSHPGITLEDKIQEMEMTVREFAIRAAQPEKAILAVLRGDSAITTDLAEAFETVTRIPAHFWLNRQRLYNDSLARLKKLRQIEEVAVRRDIFPVNHPSKFGWV